MPALRQIRVGRHGALRLAANNINCWQSLGRSTHEAHHHPDRRCPGSAPPAVRRLSADVPADVRRGRNCASTTRPPRCSTARRFPIRPGSRASSSPARPPASTTTTCLDGAAARLHPRRLCRQDPDARRLLRPPDHGRCAGRRRAQVREGLGPRPPRLRGDDAARPSSPPTRRRWPSPARTRTR